jgi:hypothetical protein
MKIFIVLSTFLVLVSCDTARVLTSVNYNAKSVEPEKIIDFCNKRGLEGIPILTFGGATLTQPIQLPFYPFYDKPGRYIAFDDTVSTCRDRNYYYLQIRELLNNRLKPFYPDSTYVKVTKSYKVKAKVGGPYNDNKVVKDSLITETELIGYATHLSSFSNYLLGLDGNKEDLNGLYSDYLLLYEFSIFGKRKLTSVSMKDIKNDVDKLNSEFGNKINLVFINADYLKWMN